MKTKTFVLAIAVLLLTIFLGCGKNRIIANHRSDTKASGIKSVVIYECTDKMMDPYICFDSLLTDSRCPLNATCVWQGTALVKVTFNEAGNAHNFTMSLQKFPDLGYPSDTTINGHHIAFIGLEPYPDISNPRNENVKPKATFSVTH